MRLGAALGIALLALAAAASAQEPRAVPPLAARVTDLTGTLSAAQRGGIEAKLAAFEASKGSQVAVLIVPSTAPEEIEQYSIRVVDAWKLGRKWTDDGVLLLVAKDDRRVRIEVGRGLEGALTDLASHRIIEETIVPRFRAGDFAGGIDAGVDRILGVIEGEPLPAPESAAEGAPQTVAQWSPLVLTVIPFVGLVLRVLLGPAGPFLAAAVAALVTWFATRQLGFALGVAFFTLFVGLAGARRRGWSSRRGYGGWGGGGFGGGGGGGFSGGGGGFGGGGASGSW